jgi:two-component system cell cycle sensor histidine kinase/response regulator CckA
MNGRLPFERLPRIAAPLYARSLAITCGLLSIGLFALLIESRVGGIGLGLISPRWIPLTVVLACSLGFAGIFIGGVRLVLLPPLLAELEATQREASAFRQATALARLAGSLLSEGHDRIDAVVAQGALLLNPIRRTEEDQPSRGSSPHEGQLSSPELTWLVLGSPEARRSLPRRRVDFNQIIGDIVEQLPRLLGPMIHIDAQIDPALPYIHGDPGQLHQILLSLALNAGEAMPGGGRLEFSTRPLFLPDDNAESLPPGRYVEVAISDNGVGIRDDLVGKIFDPFFTTKPMKSGSGLGLALVRALVENHGGCVDVFTQEEEGTTFTLIFPVADKVTAPQPASRPTTHSSRLVGGTETILIVDEDEVVCKTVQKILGRAGYNSIATSSAAEALRIFEVHHESIDLVLLDLSSPVIDGRSLCRKMCGITPDVRFLFSGDRGSAALPDHTRGPVGFVLKPYRIRQMTEAIRKVLDRQR